MAGFGMNPQNTRQYLKLRKRKEEIFFGGGWGFLCARGHSLKSAITWTGIRRTLTDILSNEKREKEERISCVMTIAVTFVNEGVI